ncbi:Hypothetical protein R9X50_00800400 [Acrodontium crateriforme]|uniref:Fe2OG dioxygenase domain-containing protein n=1 Tax=Acrodontium crateriforme TaxID=150365 RepID=A0AAQ3MCI3_9PEZI|nr:Hypothetical protein R9X50_00800400 [Acrodontium crateriforme]
MAQISSNATAPTADSLPDNLNHLEFDDLPAFPENVPTAPLLRLSLKTLLAGDAGEEERLWKASRELGFFYLDLRGAGGPGSEDLGEVEVKDGGVDGDGLLKDADMLFKLGEQLFALPTEEKQKYDFKDQGSYFGYKGLGAGVLDAKGTKDRNEFYNVSKDDILGTGERLPAPALLEAEDSRVCLASYIRRSHAIVSLILGRLEKALGLPACTLRDLHRLQGESGDQVRWVRAPPSSTPQSAQQQTLGEHTDFGSITILFNRLGGLQVLPPDVNGVPQQWCYVKPLRGHCVVNLGDAMVKFSAGVLRSNIHRVVAPPGEQEQLTRMSLVYFARPEDKILLKALEGSKIIDQAKTTSGEDEEDISAKEWILRRALGRRTGGDWEKAGGTEGSRI